MKQIDDLKNALEELRKPKSFEVVPINPGEGTSKTADLLRIAQEAKEKAEKERDEAKEDQKRSDR